MGYAVYSGDDVSNLGWLAHGASGVISVVGHVGWSPDPVDDRGLPRRQHHRGAAHLPALLPATRAIMGVPNYGATTAKARLQLLGVLDNRNVRWPLVPLTDEEVDDAARRPRGCPTSSEGARHQTTEEHL